MQTAADGGPPPGDQGAGARLAGPGPGVGRHSTPPPPAQSPPSRCQSCLPRPLSAGAGPASHRGHWLDQFGGAWVQGRLVCLAWMLFVVVVEDVGGDGGGGGVWRWVLCVCVCVCVCVAGEGGGGSVCLCVCVGGR